jgi:hypothetical protein
LLENFELESTQHARIVRVESTYLYAQFHTRWLKFVDDVEFFADEGLSGSRPLGVADREEGLRCESCANRGYPATLRRYVIKPG